MKKVISILLCLVVLISSFALNVSATDDKLTEPIVIDFILTAESDFNIFEDTNNTKATGLINSYALGLASNGTTLTIVGDTYCIATVVKCGYKNLVVQRRKTSSDSWEEYYDFGNVYVEAASAHLSTTLKVESGYQYRISCKHYAKKSLFVTQSISNTSGIVTVS